MAAITTEKDTPTATNRKDRKVTFTVDAPATDSFLPIAKYSPFTHEFPIALEDDEARAKGWALPGIGFPNLSTFGTSFASTFNIVFRVLVFAFKVIGAALNYLRYPLLGLVLFTFIYGHSSDVHPHPTDVVTSTMTITTTHTVTSISTIRPTSVSAEATQPPKGIPQSSTVKPMISFPTLSLAQNLSSTPVPKENMKSTTFPTSAEIPIQKAAGSANLAKENHLYSVTVEDKSEKTISTGDSNVAKTFPTVERVIPLPKSIGGTRTTGVKKRMYG